MSAKYTFLAWDTPVASAPLKLALLQLADNSDDNGFSYYSISKMSTKCGMSERTFMRKIADLEELNILTVERRANRPSLYTLIGDEMGVTLCHLQKTQVTESHPEVTESHLLGDRESPLGVTESHPILTVTPNNNPKRDPNNKDLVDFSIFQMSEYELSELKRIRKSNKGGKITQRVANELAKQFFQAAEMGYSFDESLTEWETRGWKSFKSEWLNAKAGQANNDSWHEDLGL